MYSSAPMPKVFRTEYTVSIYATITPKITSIHAASLIFGQSKIAKNAAIAPKINWLETKIVCPASINIVSLNQEENSSHLSDMKSGENRNKWK